MEGADCVAGQLRGDKECPFSGVSKFCRIWRKVPESDARSVLRGLWVPLSGLLGHRSRVALAPARTFGLCEHAVCLLSSEDV